MKGILLAIGCVLLSACSSYAGRGLQPGQATGDEVRTVMGAPAMSWTLPDGGQQLAYPRGPVGVHTWMVFLDRNGRLEEIVNVLDMEHFARVRAGMTQDEVLQLLGPPQPQWTAYFAARDELVWEWRYCDSWNDAARFDVLFDGTSKLVRSTLTWTESLNSNYRITCAR